MAQEVVLNVAKRSKGTNSVLTTLRSQDIIPGIIYGGDKEPIPISVETKVLMAAVSGERGGHAVFSITVDNESQLAILKDVQRDKVSGAIIHVDFQRISMNKKIEVEVDVKVTGDAPGIKAGGVLGIALHKMWVSSLPQNIPHHITIDISGLEMGKAIHVKEVGVPEGVTLLADPESVVLSITQPVEEEVAPAAAPTSAEPEVISKGKKEEEGAAPAAAAPPTPGKK